MQEWPIGITPACAGKSYRVPDWQSGHPGSPPRVRGKAKEVVSVLSCPGITPACAGKSGGYGIINTNSEDHPRVCGEKQDLELSTHTI